jgi:hypothetical protein
LPRWLPSTNLQRAGHHDGEGSLLRSLQSCLRLRGSPWPGNIAPWPRRRWEFRTSRRIGAASNGSDVILAFAKRHAGFGVRRRIGTLCAFLTGREKRGLAALADAFPCQKLTVCRPGSDLCKELGTRQLIAGFAWRGVACNSREMAKASQIIFYQTPGRCEQHPSRPSSGSTTGSWRGRRIDYFDARFNPEVFPYGENIDLDRFAKPRL